MMNIMVRTPVGFYVILITMIVHLGKRHCTLNVHLTSHLCHYVRLYGPLWTHSAFPFEDFMGSLLSNSHGTHAIEKQVSDNITRMILKINATSDDNYIFPSKTAESFEK